MVARRRLIASGQPFARANEIFGMIRRGMLLVVFAFPWLVS